MTLALAERDRISGVGMRRARKMDEGGDESGLPGKQQERLFSLSPAPPARDLLADPLKVGALPTVHLPPDTWTNRVSRMLDDYRLAPNAAVDSLRWRVADALAGLRSAVGASGGAGAGGGAGGGNGNGNGNGNKVAGKKAMGFGKVTHPYDLLDAFALLVGLPETVAADRRSLEATLAVILRAYAAEMTTMNGFPLSFLGEADEFLRAGFQLERFFSRSKFAEERQDMVTGAYTNYYHGSRYYLFGLVSRIEPVQESRLFHFFCRGVYFMARITATGDLLERPVHDRLPSRASVLFHARRDAAVLAKAKAESAYSAQVNAMIRSFPE